MRKRRSPWASGHGQNRLMRGMCNKICTHKSQPDCLVPRTLPLSLWDPRPREQSWVGPELPTCEAGMFRKEEALLLQRTRLTPKGLALHPGSVLPGFVGLHVLNCSFKVIIASISYISFHINILFCFPSRYLITSNSVAKRPRFLLGAYDRWWCWRPPQAGRGTWSRGGGEGAGPNHRGQNGEMTHPNVHAELRKSDTSQTLGSSARRKKQNFPLV